MLQCKSELKTRAFALYPNLVLLCAPQTALDCLQIYAAHFGFGMPSTRNDFTNLGQITLAASRKTPLLIVFAGMHAGSPKFLHFSEIERVLFEEDMHTPCAFAVIHKPTKKKYVFFAASSKIYSMWIAAMNFSLDIARLYENKLVIMERVARFCECRDRGDVRRLDSLPNGTFYHRLMVAVSFKKSDSQTDFGKIQKRAILP